MTKTTFWEEVQDTPKSVWKKKHSGRSCKDLDYQNKFEAQAEMMNFKEIGCKISSQDNNPKVKKDPFCYDC